MNDVSIKMVVLCFTLYYISFLFIQLLKVNCKCIFKLKPLKWLWSIWLKNSLNCTNLQRQNWDFFFQFKESRNEAKMNI